MNLSRREREVVELVARGMTYKDAAERLGITIHALKARASRAYDKLGASNCREAARLLKCNKRLRSQDEGMQLTLVA